LLGNIYSFNPSQLGRLTNQNGNFAFNNAQNFLNGASETGIDNIFKGNLPNPQTMGLGGPQERAYPPISPPEDLYPKVPGTDQGVPDRVYPAPGGDVYANVPGTDLGVPDRAYPVFNEQVYGTPPTPNQLSNNLDVYTTPPPAGTLEESQVYPEEAARNDFDNLGEQVYPEKKMVNTRGELREPSNTFDQQPAKVYVKPKDGPSRGDIGKVYPPTSGDFMVDKPLDLGNLKPPTKYNISTGGFNTSKTEFE
jgi:hypothetical protein